MKHDQIADYLNQTITDALQAQNLRFREQWEPQVVAALAPLPDECLAKIKPALARQRRLPWHRRNPAALRLELGAGCAPPGHGPSPGHGGSPAGHGAGGKRPRR